MLESTVNARPDMRKLKPAAHGRTLGAKSESWAAPKSSFKFFEAKLKHACER